MEILKSSDIPSKPSFRRGFNPVLSTQRSKMQSKRTLINQQLFKQMRIRTGAENLLRATSNTKVKETVALELSFVNSNLQLLKEELSDINSSVEAYQNKSSKATSIPMLSFGLKDTNELDLIPAFETVITEHYKEDSRNYTDELADLADMRNAVRTPSRSLEGVSLLLEYYNQLYFIENRFFSANKPPNIFFHWYDCITGEPSAERSVSLEKAGTLFNVGALYSQIGTRADRSRKKDIEVAIDSYQRSAGVFKYMEKHFNNAPTIDLSAAFLKSLSDLMLAQAQECHLEHKILGGFEIQLGKCVAIAQEAMMVAKKYKEAEKSLEFGPLQTYVPFSWINMVRVKHHHYNALAHYYAGLGLLEQHEAAESVEIAKLLSILYLENEALDVPKPNDAARRKEDRRRLGKSHLRHAVSCHEQALQTHSLCSISRKDDTLKDYLQHAHNRSVAKFTEVDSEQDFFDLLETPSIHAYTENQVTVILPAFESAPSKDIFRQLGPLTIFSAHNRLSAPLEVTLTVEKDDLGFTVSGDSPVTINNLNETMKKLGLKEGDVIVAVDGVDMKWCHQKFVYDLIRSCRGIPVRVKVISLLGSSDTASTTTTYSSTSSTSSNKNIDENNVETKPNQDVQQYSYSKSHEANANNKKRNSFSFLNSLKRRPKQNRLSNLPQTVSYHAGSVQNIHSFTLQRKPLKPDPFTYSSATVLRKKKEIIEYSTDF